MSRPTRPASSHGATTPDGETPVAAGVSETAPLPDQRLDVRGLLCPIPVQRTAARVGRLAAESLLEVVGDDPLMRLDLAAWAAREGHEVLAMEEAGGLVRCLLRVRRV